MKKISLALALVMLLVGVSADAQKKKGGHNITPAPIRADMVVEDQNGEGFITFNPETSEFTCQMCKYGYVWSGTGKVEAKGLNVYFNAMTDSYRIFVSLNIEDGQGKAVIQVLKDPVTGFAIQPLADYFNDGDIYNNNLACGQ